MGLSAFLGASRALASTILRPESSVQPDTPLPDYSPSSRAVEPPRRELDEDEIGISDESVDVVVTMEQVRFVLTYKMSFKTEK